MDDYTERLLLLANSVLYNDISAPARDGLPDQGTVRYWIIEWVMNKRKLMPDGLVASSKNRVIKSEKAVKPQRRKIKFSQPCDYCDGCGWVEGGECLKSTCPQCGGSGNQPPLYKHHRLQK